MINYVATLSVESYMWLYISYVAYIIGYIFMACKSKEMREINFSVGILHTHFGELQYGTNCDKLKQ